MWRFDRQLHVYQLLSAAYVWGAKMSKILLCVFGSAGDLSPFLLLGDALKSRGHEVVVGGADRLESEIVAAGFQYRNVRPNIAETERDTGFDWDGCVSQMLKKWSPIARNQGTGFLFQKMILPYLEGMYEDTLAASEDVDVIIAHSILFGVGYAAEKRRIPNITIALQPFLFASAYEPFVPPDLPYNSRKIFSAFGPAVARVLIDAFYSVANHWGKPAIEFRHKIGLAPIDGNPIFRGPFETSITLALFPEQFAPRLPDYPKRLEYADFLIDADAPELTFELESFLQSGTPPIVFTLGSAAVLAAGDFYMKSMEVAKKLEERAVLLIGPAGRSALPNDLPDGVFACDSAPHGRLFPRCKIIVHSSGIGTLAQALRSGKPQLIVPCANDQFDNASRAEGMGLAKVIPRPGYSVDRAASKLRELIANPEYGEKAAAAKDQFDTGSGLTKAAEIIERLAAAFRQ
jgi:rhamnosyltransferase subunit B